jgi:hypothetical protein
MVNKTIKIKLNVSNKLLYSILAIILVIGISAVVYAYNPSGTGGNPAIFGHSADEINGVCMSDGTFCSATSNNDERFTIKAGTGKLCYDYPTTTGCTTQSEICSSTKQITVDPGTNKLGVCTSECLDTIACNGKTITGCNKGTIVNYNKGIPTSGTNNKCTCSFNPPVNYLQEVSTSGTVERCI